jgi:hypothetical protein
MCQQREVEFSSEKIPRRTPQHVTCDISVLHIWPDMRQQRVNLNLPRMPAARTKKYTGGRNCFGSGDQYKAHPQVDFEELDSDPTHVKCLACSAASDTGETIILKSTRKKHLTSDKHSNTVKHLESIAARQPPGAAPSWSQSASVEQARFTLSTMLVDSDSENDQPQQHHSQLDDIMMDGDQFFDAGRNEMFFSAGIEDVGAARRKALLEGIRNLDYYDHTVFGKVDREDSTISEAVATMVDMGKFRSVTQIQIV